MSSALRTSVLGGYRRLLRARLIAFSGDDNAIAASRLELRTHILNNANVEKSQAEIMVKEMIDLEDVLLGGIVQGEVKQGGDEVKVEIQLRKENAEVMDKESINPIEHLGGGLGEAKTKGLDDVKIEKS
mmetsp:Transcript_13135/g.26794  ORF Transcript_13135/g.26794 Transcript_13135/m.26794 type:complete len:129 (-) Transcript_13135:6-392(-)